MNISDLNYVEAISQENSAINVRGGQAFSSSASFRGFKSNRIITNQDLNFDTEVDFDKDFDADLNFDSDVDIQGNLSNLNFDVQALGEDTVAEADATVFSIENELSQVTFSGTAAVA